MTAPTGYSLGLAYDDPAHPYQPGGSTSAQGNTTAFAYARAGPPGGAPPDRPVLRPAKLCQAMGIGADHHGADLSTAGAVAILDDGTPPPAYPVVTTRVGTTGAPDHQWRWYVAGDPNVSRR